ncbi:prepilin peptidase [Nitrospirillum pindoramense]|uniref:prepilin peptidase n=1 Tax=Nitrospirillum amazonense TaxID=28077 RepID=UPI00119CA1F9|nr:A24 family peptidase [Nitrospirillum amazonense]
MVVPLLMAAATVDLTHRYLPDGLTVAIALLGAGTSLMGLSVTPLDGALAAVLAGSLTLALRAMVGWRLRREAMGLGDVKLFTAAGLWVGLGGVPWLLLVAALSGLAGNLVWRRLGQGTEMPFGPAIALGLFGVAWAQL